MTYSRTGADNGAGDIVSRGTCAIDKEADDQGPYDAIQVPSSGNYLPGLLSGPNSDRALGDRRWVKTCSLV